MKQYIIIAAFGCCVLAACDKKEAPAQSEHFTLSDTMQRMIQLDTVSVCTLDEELSLSGEIGFNENSIVKIFPRSSGQVLSTKVSLGDHVKKGEAIALISSADVAGTYSDLKSAEAELTTAKRQMEAAENLYKNGISSEKEYTEAKENYQKALAGKVKVQSLININGGGRTSADGNYIITSPIDGYIVEKAVNAGDFIRPDMGATLFTISDLRDVWVYANVYESDISKVKEGADVTVIPLAYTDKVFKGKIDRTNQVLDPESKVMRIRITLDNKDMLLKPDMFARIVVNNSGTSQATCIPTAAVLSQDGKDYIVTYKSKSDMAIVEINIVKTTGNKTYISNNLPAGQKLITRNQLIIFNQLLNE
jgi:membrane fusion protein, heavy metal efflux system